MRTSCHACNATIPRGQLCDDCKGFTVWKTIRRNCTVCKSEFIPKSFRNKKCEDCSMGWKTEKKCKYCGKTFVGYPNRMYCSRKCVNNKLWGEA